MPALCQHCCSRSSWPALSADKANKWYAQQPWLVNANYVPSDAINQLEMFQPATWDPATNDRELGLAESIGMNTMRVFLHDQLWESDPAGFTKRLDAFLTIANKHHIRPMLVLFDSCWEPLPKLGPQHPPVPGVHNSGWVQSPGSRGLSDPAYVPEMKAYVQGSVKTFGHDPRVLAWDVWNEPDNDNGGNFQGEIKNKAEAVDKLLPTVFGWAREENPDQPLTSGVWAGNWTDPQKMSATTKIQLDQSDIITFHEYGWFGWKQMCFLSCQSFRQQFSKASPWCFCARGAMRLAWMPLMRSATKASAIAGISCRLNALSHWLPGRDSNPRYCRESVPGCCNLLTLQERVTRSNP